jgi:hypothetical protein
MAFLDAIDFGLPIDYFTSDRYFTYYAAGAGPYGETVLYDGGGATTNNKARILSANWPANNTIFLHFHQMMGVGRWIRILPLSDGGTGQYTLTIDFDALGYTSGVYAWVAVKIVIDNIAGGYEVRINNKTVMSATGIDTQAAADASIGGLYFYRKMRMTNLILHDETGADGFTGFLSDEHRMLRRLPNGQGNYAGFTSSSGDQNWQNVDEADVDGDTTYNESGVVGAKDSQNYEDVPALSGFSAKAVTVDTIAKKTDTATTQITTFRRDGSTDTDLSTHSLSSGYERFMDNLGGMAETDVNALEIGCKVAVA